MQVSGQFPIDRSAPRRARELLEELRDVLDDDAVASAALVVSELVANCVLHGGQEGRISVCLRRDSHSSLFAFVADGVGEASSGPLRRPSERTGGIGLRIVDRLASHWGVEDEESETIVWAELPAAV